jgi:hypothetical protein
MISTSIIHADFVASPRPPILAPKICTISMCESTHSYSCPGCGAVHSFDCTCEHDIFDNEHTDLVISAADAIKFASIAAFTALVSPTVQEINKYENIIIRFFSEWRERSDVSLEETVEFLFYDAEAVYYNCMRIRLDLGLQKAIQYYSQLDKYGRFEGKPRYFCDYPGSSLNTVNTLDSLIYEIIVYIKNHCDEFCI